MTRDEAVAVMSLALEMSVQTTLDLAAKNPVPTPAFDTLAGKLRETLTEIVMRDAGDSQ